MLTDFIENEKYDIIQHHYDTSDPEILKDLHLKIANLEPILVEHGLFLKKGRKIFSRQKGVIRCFEKDKSRKNLQFLNAMALVFIIMQSKALKVDFKEISGYGLASSILKRMMETLKKSNFGITVQKIWKKSDVVLSRLYYGEFKKNALDQKGFLPIVPALSNIFKGKDDK